MAAQERPEFVDPFGIFRFSVLQTQDLLRGGWRGLYAYKAGQCSAVTVMTRMLALDPIPVTQYDACGSIDIKVSFPIVCKPDQSHSRPRSFRHPFTGSALNPESLRESGSSRRQNYCSEPQNIHEANQKGEPGARCCRLE